MRPKHSLNHNIKSVPLVLTGNTLKQERYTLAYIHSYVSQYVLNAIFNSSSVDNIASRGPDRPSGCPKAITLVFGLAPGLSSPNAAFSRLCESAYLCNWWIDKVEESALAKSSGRLLANELLKMPVRSCVLIWIQNAHNLAEQTFKQLQIAILFQR